MSASRSALLGDIQKGRALKKTQTNDRSAPSVGKASLIIYFIWLSQYFSLSFLYSVYLPILLCLLFQKYVFKVVGSSSGSAPNASDSRSPSNSVSNAPKMPSGGGMGGLFANGLPTRPSDNKKKPFGL